jgi:hypothetical protein
MRPYEETDFIPIRDFLVETYAYFGRPYNWMIDRWNFSASLARVMNGVSREEWASRIALWEHGGAILAVVNAEGEDDGEAFFQVAHEDLPDEIVEEMFGFCEAHLGKEKQGKWVIYLRISPEFPWLEAAASRRNYTRLPQTEPVAELSLVQAFPVELPPGYSFLYGDYVTPSDKGEAHARAFGYADDPVYRPRSTVGYHEAALTPDYRADLDLYVRSPAGEIASFATMWYDRRNRIGILEPVGTVPDHRKLGLGRATIFQLANQILPEGATKVYVGSRQPFYLRLGFQDRVKYSIWTKEMDLD